MHTGIVILAGGRSSRMGEEKSLLSIAGVPLIERIVCRLGDHHPIVINANGDPSRFSIVSCPIIPDSIGSFSGPLAGILSGLEWASSPLTHMVSIAVDTPFFPKDLVSIFESSVSDSPDTIALAMSDNNLHPVFGLWPISLSSSLREFLTAGSSGKVLDFVHQHDWKKVSFPFSGSIDPFFNINTPADLSLAQSHASEQ